MQLEDYFDFEQLPTGERIRLKGTRIAIEDILFPYLEGDSAERVFYDYKHAVSLEQVHATITYYLHNFERIEKYLQATRELEDRLYEEYRNQEPSKIIKRLRGIKYQQRSAQSS